MVCLLALILVFCLFSFAWCSCPSNEYVVCGQDHGSCSIPGSIKKGYISYGVRGRYSLIPFTNTGSSTLTIQCDSDNGDLYYGVTKYCCYMEVEETGFDSNSFGNYLVERDGGWTYSGIWSMNYGANNKYVYRVISGDAIGWCQNSFFNDPVYTVTKHCRRTSLNPPILDSTTWTICANANNYCNGLDSSAHWIRYGSSTYNKFYYRLVVTSDGQVPCNNRFFEDPAVGKQKFCWKSEAIYSFSGASGYWQRIPSCGGCSSNEYTKTIGIEELTSSEMSESWEYSLTATLSSDYFFGGVELSASIANSVTNTLTSALTTSTTLETKYICEKDSVYQWITDVTQNNGITIKDFTISSEDFWCIDLGLMPQCPPGYCKDDNCQECI